jgi:branched-chain amino acid transport system substrate-binding protein
MTKPRRLRNDAQDPLSYAPRSIRDAIRTPPPSSASPSNRINAEPTANDRFRDKGDGGIRYLPSVYVWPDSWSPQPRRSSVSILLEALSTILVAGAAASLVTVYLLPPWQSPRFAVVGRPPARTESAPSLQMPRANPASDGAAGASLPAAAAVVSRPPASAVRGVIDSEIRLGISAPFTGPSSELGHEMQVGIETAFNAVNESGGVQGRKLRLVAADDGYEPDRTVETMKQLYENDRVFGVIGNVGTPTAMVALPYALDHRMLFFGAFTGASMLRKNPPDRYVFNFRASYAEETDAVVHYLVKVLRLRPEQIAVFAQQDAYGDAGFAGVARAISGLRGGEPGAVLRLSYKRNMLDVEDAVAQLRAYKLPLKAVVMVATYRAAAKFIEKTRDAFPQLIYTNVSFVGSTALANELMLLGPRFAAGIIVTQVVPPVDSNSTAILEYRSALARSFRRQAPDYVSLEGYLAARVLAEAMRRTASGLDTEKLVDGLEGLHDFNMGIGTPINFGPTEHQGVHKVWGTQLDQNGQYHTIDLHREDPQSPERHW